MEVKLQPSPVTGAICQTKNMSELSGQERSLSDTTYINNPRPPPVSFFFKSFSFDRM